MIFSFKRGIFPGSVLENDFWTPLHMVNYIHVLHLDLCTKLIGGGGESPGVRGGVGGGVQKSLIH